MFLLLISLLTAAKVSYQKSPFNPDLDQLEGRVCYQCESNESEILPTCGSALFLTGGRENKLDFVFQCPRKLQSYCVRAY